MKKKIVSAVAAIFILFMSSSIFLFVDSSSIVAGNTTEIDDPKNTLRTSAVSHLFDGMFITHLFDGAPATFSYTPYYGDLWYESWDGFGGDTWVVDTLTREMSGGSVFSDGAHTLAWIFTDINLGDIVPVAVDGEALSHSFLVSSEFVYDLPGFGLVDVWELTDQDVPGAWAWYEQSTGILLNGYFLYSGGSYDYTMDFVNTNAFSPTPSGQIAIFRNVYPWDYNVTEPILNMYGISYTVYSSADMGSVDLSSYEKVIIESDQDQMFYDALGMNIAWFESYASSGGILEIHACDGGWNYGNWHGLYLMPGGVDQIHTSTDSVSINLPTHPIVNDPHTITDTELDSWSASAHGSFVTYPAGSKEILLDGDSLNPVLIEFDYGAGTILLSMQTLEFGYGYGYSLILENIILYTPSIEGIVILFDEAHFPVYSIGSNPSYSDVGGYSEFAGTLTAAGYTVGTIDPGTVIDATVLSGCDILVIVASQNPYTTAELDAIETWVRAGGNVLLITDWGDFGDDVELLATRFGFDFKNDCIEDSDDGVGTGVPAQLFYDGPNILSHPITAGVSRVEMYAGDGFITVPVDEIPIIKTDTDGTATWFYDGSPALGVSVMSLVDDGSAGAGKVCVIGDTGLWVSSRDTDSDGDLNFYDSDNEILAMNTINWLVPAPPDSITVTSPDSSSSWETGTTHSINWTSTGSITDVEIELYKDGEFILEVVASTVNDGEFSWAIPSGLEDGIDYQIKVSDVSNPTTHDFSDNFEIFTIPVGVVILFDEAHLPLYSIGSNPAYEVVGGYSEFAGTLTAAGYTVLTIDPGTVIDSTVLSGCDILVIVATQSAYTTAELDAIENWVAAGGSVLLLTERQDLGLVMDPLVTRFGFDRADDIIYESDDYVGGTQYWPFYDGPNILSHPITTGVSRVEMYAGDGLIAVPIDEIPLIITDTDGTTTWGSDGSPALGVSVMSVVDDGSVGAGKVCVIGDSNLWDSVYDVDSDGDLDFYDSDNEILAINTINWFAPAPEDSITVTSPDALTVWEMGTSQDINWTSTGTISDVKIELYKGGEFILEIIASTPNDGVYTWDIPTYLEEGIDYQINVSDVANPTTYDESPEFYLYSTEVDSLTVTSPDSSSSWETGTTQDITWASTGSISDVKIELYKDGVFEREIIASTANDGSYTWEIPTDLEDGTDYQINISDVSNPTTHDLSDNFEIFTTPEVDSLTITSPNSLSSWETGTTEFISWTHTGTILDVKIELYKDGEFELEIDASTANDGEFSWTIPSGLDNSTQYQIKISDVSNPTTHDFSDNFEIFTTPEVDSLTVTSPVSLTAWEMGTSQEITWTSTGSISDVKIELYKDGVFVLEIVASTANDGSYTWDIPTDLEDGNDYQIKISDVANPATYDESSVFGLTSVDIPGDGAIPSYNLYIVIGMISVISVLLVKKRVKFKR